jgi:hypothetical protein
LFIFKETEDYPPLPDGSTVGLAPVKFFVVVDPAEGLVADFAVAVEGEEPGYPPVAYLTRDEYIRRLEICLGKDSEKEIKDCFFVG